MIAFIPCIYYCNVCSYRFIWNPMYDIFAIYRSMSKFTCFAHCSQGFRRKLRWKLLASSFPRYHLISLEVSMNISIMIRHLGLQGTSWQRPRSIDALRLRTEMFWAQGHIAMRKIFGFIRCHPSEFCESWMKAIIIAWLFPFLWNLIFIIVDHHVDGMLSQSKLGFTAVGKGPCHKQLAFWL